MNKPTLSPSARARFLTGRGRGPAKFLPTSFLKPPLKNPRSAIGVGTVAAIAALAAKLFDQVINY